MSEPSQGIRLATFPASSRPRNPAQRRSRGTWREAIAETSGGQSRARFRFGASIQLPRSFIEIPEQRRAKPALNSELWEKIPVAAGFFAPRFQLDRRPAFTGEAAHGQGFWHPFVRDRT